MNLEIPDRSGTQVYSLPGVQSLRGPSVIIVVGDDAQEYAISGEFSLKQAMVEVCRKLGTGWEDVEIEVAAAFEKLRGAGNHAVSYEQLLWEEVKRQKNLEPHLTHPPIPDAWPLHECGPSVLNDRPRPLQLPSTYG